MEVEWRKIAGAYLRYAWLSTENVKPPCKGVSATTVAVAKKRKDKQERRDKQREAVKERTADTLRMRAASPTKAMDLQLKRDMVKSICKTGEVRRIEKMLNLLERHKDRMDEDVYDARVNSLIVHCSDACMPAARARWS